MFSSNQIFEVSGSMEQMKITLDFALKMSGAIDLFTRKENPIKCIYQITEDGRYCIGVGYYEKEGWNEYPFDFDTNIIAQIIAQHLNKQSIPYNNMDGTSKKGFLMKSVPKSYADEKNGIKNPSFALFEFSIFETYYAK